MSYTKKQIRGGFFMVPLGGVDLRVYKQHPEVVDRETGEVLQDAYTEEFYTLGLTAGQHQGNSIAEAAPQNARFEPVGDNAPAVRVVGNARTMEENAMKPQQPKDKHATGANETYKPTTTDEERLQRIVDARVRSHMNEERKREEKRDAKRKQKELQLQQKREERRQAKEDAKEKAEEEARQKKLEEEKAAAEKAAAEAASSE